MGGGVQKGQNLDYVKIEWSLMKPQRNKLSGISQNKSMFYESRKLHKTEILQAWIFAETFSIKKFTN